MERASLTRLRWRLRGAWQWPTFGVLLVVDAVLLSVLPIAGDEEPDAFAAAVLSLFFNLVAIAVLGPVFGWLWRRRQPELPSVVARDRGGTAGLVLVTAVLLALGIVHHTDVTDQREELAVQALIVARYVGHRTEPQYRQYRAHVDEMNTVSLGEGLYRACIPGDDPARALCLFIHTDQSPPGVTEDPSRAPNATYVQRDGR
jgi:fatty acid desaturase